MDTTIERTLIAQCKKGDRAAISELVEQHYARALRTARRIVRSDEDAKDMVQAAFCSAIQHLSGFRGDASFSTWITTIVSNRCLMELRDPWKKRARLFSLTEATSAGKAVSTESSPYKYTYQREVVTQMGAAISRLPADLRVTLYVYSDLSVQEVASSLGLSLAAAKTRIFRARKCLKISIAQMTAKDAPRLQFAGKSPGLARHRQTD